MMGKRGRQPWMVYTVYDNKTDLPVIVDGTAAECARAMGISCSSFRSLVTLCAQGKIKRWTVLKSDVRELEAGT